MTDQAALKARELTRRIRELYDGTMGVKTSLMIPGNRLGFFKEEAFETLDKMAAQAAPIAPHESTAGTVLGGFKRVEEVIACSVCHADSRPCFHFP